MKRQFRSTMTSSPVRYFAPETLEQRVLFSTWVDAGNRAAVTQLYNTGYVGSQGVPIGWTGNINTGDPGTTSAAFKASIKTRIDFYRSLAGLDDMLDFDPVHTQKDQAAALMSSANNDISHNPPAGWQFRTADAVEAAAHSSLSLFSFGPAAIDAYMDDSDPSNVDGGHRRPILYPQDQRFGTGDVPGDANHPASNALWTYDEHYFDPRPATRQPYVAWPNPGFIPYQVVFPRFSFGYPGANFANATVAVTRNGSPVAVTVVSRTADFADPTILWDVPGPFTSADTVYNVQVNNVVINGAAQNFSYSTTTYDPTAVVAPAPTVTAAAIGTAGNSTQRSTVKQIAFTFDRAVTLAAGALSLSLLNTGGSGTNNGAAPTNATAALTNPTSSNGGATWTFTFAAGTFTEASASLKDGIYTLNLDASKVTAGGTPMVANYGQTFHRLFGDIQGNKTVNNADYFAFRNTFGKPAADPAFDAAFDFNGDGLINNTDYFQFRNRFSVTFTY